MSDLAELIRSIAELIFMITISIKAFSASNQPTVESRSTGSPASSDARVDAASSPRNAAWNSNARRTRLVGLLVIFFAIFMVTSRQFLTPADALLTTRDAASLLSSGLMFLMGLFLMRD